MPGHNKSTCCPANGVIAAWKPDRFLPLSLPYSLGWHVRKPLVLLPAITGIPAGRLFVKGQFVRWVARVPDDQLLPPFMTRGRRE
jgi:hypothetical protein